MPYVSLYRKYRSQTFDDVVGQDHVVRTIRNAIASGRIAHGYLFCGSRGTGKTTVARLLAKALNCEQGPTPNPCSKCEACESITAGTAVDVIEMDAASNRGIDDIRALNEQARYAPMRLRYKVYIIDEAHQITADAKDAFLKTLEEPPSFVVFILATTEANKIPVTIRSRCQQFDFRRGTLGEISGRLRKVIESEQVKADDEAVELIARSASGSYRDALSVLEQVMAYTDGVITAADVHTVLGTLDEEALMEIGSVLAGDDTAAALELADRLLREGRDVRELLQAAANHFRDVLAVKVGADPKRAADEKWRKQADLYSPDRLLRLVEVMSEAERELRWSEQHRLALELAFLKGMAEPEPLRGGDFKSRPSGKSPASGPISEKEGRPIDDRPAARPRPIEAAPSPAAQPVTEPAGAAKVEAAQEAGEYDPYSEESVAPGSEVTLGDIRREWPAVLRHLQKGLRQASLEAMVREGSPLNFEDGVLTIGFSAKYGWHRNKTQTSAQTIERAIRDVLGANVKITTAVTDAGAPAGPPKPAKIEAGDLEASDKDQHPLLDDVMTMFDGKLEEDDHDPWEETS